VLKSVVCIIFINLFFISSTFLQAKEIEISDQNYGDLSGLIRLYHVFSPSYVKSGRNDDYSIDGSAVGGHVRYISPTLDNLSVSSAIYYAKDTGLNDTGDINTIMAAGRFFKKDYSDKAVLGEVSFLYKDQEHIVIIGRQKIDSPLTNSIVTFMPNMYEALFYNNKHFKELEFSLFHINKMAYGTRAPVEFGLIGETTRTAGSTQSAIDNRGDFAPIEQQVLADPSVNTNGVTGFSLTNRSFKNNTIRICNFYAYDIINMFYVDSVYKNFKAKLPYSISVQYLNVKSVGKNLASAWLDGSNASMLGLKFAFDYQNISAYLAYNHSGNQKLLNPFNGDPAYTSSFFSRNAYRSDVDAYKIGVNFKITKDFKIISSYADYGKSSTIGTFAPSQPVQVPTLPQNNAKESALLFSYNPIKNFNVLTGAIYKTSEYYYALKQVKLLDLDFVATYKF